MATLAAIYLLITVGVALVCALANRVDEKAGDLYTASVVVLFFACLTALIHMWVPPPWGSAANPVQDLICIVLFIGAWKSTGARWAAALVVMFLIQLALHAGYWITGDFSDHARRLYAIKINSIYCGELAVLFLTGGGHVVRYCSRVIGLPRRWAVASISRVR